MKHLLLIAASILGLAACQPAPAPAPASTIEAETFCLPRQCGRIPICTDNSVARCTPDNGCHWQCVPLNQTE